MYGPRIMGDVTTRRSSSRWEKKSKNCGISGRWTCDIQGKRNPIRTSSCKSWGTIWFSLEDMWKQTSQRGQRGRRQRGKKSEDKFSHSKHHHNASFASTVAHVLEVSSSVVFWSHAQG